MALIDLAKMSQYARSAVQIRTNPSAHLLAAQDAFPVITPTVGATWVPLGGPFFDADPTHTAGYSIDVDGLITYTAARSRKRPLIRAAAVLEPEPPSQAFISLAIAFNGVVIEQSAATATSQGEFWLQSLMTRWVVPRIRTGETFQVFVKNLTSLANIRGGVVSIQIL